MSNNTTILPRFRCPSCGTKMKADTELGGQEVACPRCNEGVTVPVVSFGINDKISGFLIEDWIGSGAMGEVYRARQLSMDRPVALKLLRKDLTDDDESVERFNNEVRLLASLDHPNIVTAFEAGQYKGFYFLAMSYVNGYNLDECLMERGKLPEKETLKVASKVGKALSYAWDRHKLLHRDIKPSNIMIDTDGEVKLTDMGISVRVGERFEGIEGGYAIGTPLYMSPEQASGRSDLDFRADLFSLGATLYHLVVGQPPFDGDTPTDIMLQVINEPLPDPKKLNPQLTDACCRLMKRMMAKSKEDRYSTWDDCILDMQKAIRGEEDAQPAGATAGNRKATSPKKKFKASLDVKSPHLSHVGPHVPTTTRKSNIWLPIVAAIVGIALIGFVIFQLSHNQARAPHPPPAEEIVVPEPKVPAVPAEDTRMQALDKQYKQALAYASDNPTDFDGMQQRFQQLREKAARTKYEMMAKDELDKVAEMREADIRQARQMMEMELQQFLDKKQPLKALAYLNSYDGPYKQETSKWRDKQIAILRRHQQIANRQHLEQAAEAKRKLISLADIIAGQLIRKDYAGANTTLDEALKSPDYQPAKATLVELRKLTDTLGAWPEAVRATFVEDAGKDVEVDLKSGGPTKLTIREVDGPRIKTLREMGNGRIGVTLTLGDLTVPEYLKRLERWDKPSRPLALGLINLWARQGAQALAIFGQLPEVLCNALTRQVHVLFPEAVEEAALTTLNARLAAFQIPVDHPYETQKFLKGNNLSETQQRDLRQFAETFEARFGSTKVSTTWSSVLKLLQGVEVQAWPINRENLQFVWLNAERTEVNGLEDPATGNWVSCTPLAGGDARFTPEGAMLFTHGEAHFLSESAGERITQACRQSQEFGLECVIQPTDLIQGGPALIVSLSSSAMERNFSLGQAGNRLSIRLRTPFTDLNGSRLQIQFADLNTVKMPCHVVISYRSGELTAYLNGEQALSYDGIQGGLDNWTTQPLIFGNEVEGNRPWGGQLQRIAVYARVIGKEEAASLYSLYQDSLAR